MTPVLPIAGLVLFVVTGLAAMGVTPVRQLIELLPFTAVTQARRLFFGMHLGGAMLAAVGAHVMLRGGRRSVNATAAGLLVVGVTIVAVLFFHDHLAKFREAWSK